MTQNPGLPEDIREYLENRPDPKNLNSGPLLHQFNPKVIDWQWRVINLLRRDYDHSSGTPHILLSGAYGSAKSMLLAHIAVTHCLFFRKARVIIARRALPDLKRTLFKEILQHLGAESDQESTGLIAGEDYHVNKQEAYIRFSNGSEIIGISWADKKYDRARSIPASGVMIEELVENDDEDKEAFDELVNRVRRIPGVHEKENFVIAATNPDEPEHWAHQHFIESDVPDRYVFYSKTFENPWMDPVYIRNQFYTLSPRQILRYVYGEWVELTKNVIYYEYRTERNFVNRSYQVDPKLPVWLCWDFNIGEGKPLSGCYFQYDPKEDTFHVFGEVIIEGARTHEAIEQVDRNGILTADWDFMIAGDATGKRNDTRSKKTDWSIIEDYLSNWRDEKGRHIDYTMEVPVQNPPIRKRHNWVNAYCRNGYDQVRLYVYKDAPTVNRGLKLTSFKKGSDQEDDAKTYQHVTTALGYGMVRCIKKHNNSMEVTKDPR